jgi:hypothetical protein
VAGDELPGEPDGDAVLVDRAQAVVGNAGDGDHTPVLEPLTASPQRAVDEEAVTGAVYRGIEKAQVL